MRALQVLPLMLVWLLLPNKTVSASQDQNSYGTFVNPNLAYSHYYAEASDVLQGLSGFRALYVSYHSCAWSPFYSDDNNDKRENQHSRFLPEDNRGGERQCGRRGGEGDGNWYRGMGECYGANVAYSLYGVLESDRLIMTNPCGRQTFINSFFTTDGLVNFAEASNGAVDTSSISQTCTSLDNGHTTTVGCSAAGTFTVDEFNGNGCIGAYYDQTLNTLESLNTALSKHMRCKLIYHNDESVDYATELLSNSMVCSTKGFNKNYCPDPYHMMQVYDYNFARAQQNKNYSVINESALEIHRVLREVGGTLLLITGCVLLVMTVRKWIRTTQQMREESEHHSTEVLLLSDGGLFS